MSGRTEALPCAYCRRQVATAAWRPFCSQRCQQQDLARWVDGSYRIPGEPVDASDADTPPDADSNVDGRGSSS